MLERNCMPYMHAAIGRAPPDLGARALRYWPLIHGPKIHMCSLAEARLRDKKPCNCTRSSPPAGRGAAVGRAGRLDLACIEWHDARHTCLESGPVNRRQHAAAAARKDLAARSAPRHSRPGARNAWAPGTPVAACAHANLHTKAHPSKGVQQQQQCCCPADSSTTRALLRAACVGEEAVSMGTGSTDYQALQAFICLSCKTLMIALRTLTSHSTGVAPFRGLRTRNRASQACSR